MNTNEKQHLINLYLEQIKYLAQENMSIQNNFLAGVNLPLAALGLLIYYIETSNKISAQNIYIILPFLYFFIPYNLIKFSTRMLSIDAYLTYLENQINTLMGKDVFLWNKELIDCSLLPCGFGKGTTIVQLPIHLVSIFYLVIKFINAINTTITFKNYRIFFVTCLILELFGMLIMLIDAACIEGIIAKKIAKIAMPKQQPMPSNSKASPSTKQAEISTVADVKKI